MSGRPLRPAFDATWLKLPREMSRAGYLIRFCHCTAGPAPLGGLRRALCTREEAYTEVGRLREGGAGLARRSDGSEKPVSSCLRLPPRRSVPPPLYIPAASRRGRLPSSTGPARQRLGGGGGGGWGGWDGRDSGTRPPTARRSPAPRPVNIAPPADRTASGRYVCWVCRVIRLIRCSNPPLPYHWLSCSSTSLD